MAKPKTIILTKNKEIYNKFNSLLFSNEVVIDNSKIKQFQLNKILKNINKRSREDDVIEKILLGDYTLLRKRSNFDFSIYFKEN